MVCAKRGEIMPELTAEEVRYLTEEVGLSEREIELRMRDDDLWLLGHEFRFAWEPGEEDVAQWKVAADFAYALAFGFNESGAIPDSLRMAFWDMRDRTAEALKRAKERAGNA
jgi:hypothetical protein